MKLTEFTSDAMMERLKVLKKERPEMEALSYILTPNQIIEWLHSIGVATDPVIRDIAPHVPPHSLRCIVAAPSEAV
ncbi:MAG: hypothetical protein ACRESZ_14795, partial [Methylococcales bacterium]